MWDQSSGGSNSTYFRKRRLEREAQRLADKRRAAAETLRGKLKRLRAQIRNTQIGADDEQVPAWAVLYDLNETSGEFFSTDRLALGDEVSVILEARETMYLKARVTGCNEIATTNTVISVRKFRYRVTLAFLYDSMEEQTSVVESLALASA